MTGRFPRPQPASSGTRSPQPPPATQACHCAKVTSVRPIANGCVTTTSTRGRSSDCESRSNQDAPMVNRPAGTGDHLRAVRAVAKRRQVARSAGRRDCGRSGLCAPLDQRGQHQHRGPERARAPGSPATPERGQSGRGRGRSRDSGRSGTGTPVRRGVDRQLQVGEPGCSPPIPAGEVDRMDRAVANRRLGRPDQHRHEHPALQALAAPRRAPSPTCPRPATRSPPRPWPEPARPRSARRSPCPAGSRGPTTRSARRPPAHGRAGRRTAGPRARS